MPISADSDMGEHRVVEMDVLELLRYLGYRRPFDRDRPEIWPTLCFLAVGFGVLHTK